MKDKNCRDYVDAKKSTLKALAKKMYKMSQKAYKEGKGPKPKPLEAEMEISVSSVDKEQAPKIDSKVRDMVRGFFKEKKEENPDIRQGGYVPRSPKMVAVVEKPVRRKNAKKSAKKAV